MMEVAWRGTALPPLVLQASNVSKALYLQITKTFYSKMCPHWKRLPSIQRQLIETWYFHMCNLSRYQYWYRNPVRNHSSEDMCICILCTTFLLSNFEHFFRDVLITHNFLIYIFVWTFYKFCVWKCVWHANICLRIIWENMCVCC